MKQMRLKPMNVSLVILLALIFSSPIVGQNTRVEVSKHLTAIPKSCVSVSPAAIDGTVDIPALVKEAICKGSGDMLADYTYQMDSVRREKDKKGKVKEERITNEVFFPTLKSGARTRGVLVVTSRNQVPVPPDELEKERVRAAERIEKEENKSARETAAPPNVTSPVVTGMLPLGQYSRKGINREAFGVRRGGATLAVTTFLKTCEPTLVRRETTGRETLIFSFAPRPDSQFTENDKYIAQLRGEIWIDVQDRIVTRLAGWPASTPAGQPPAVYVEMMRLHKHGIWLPQVFRINGADYPKLFDGVTTDSTSTYSNYIRFSSEIEDVKVGTPSKQ
ncbi:MAG: hypothetical protein ACR2HX_20145 [Pyrinomonadaceae bacterium]